MIASISPISRRAFTDLKVNSGKFKNPRTRSGLEPEAIAGLGINIGLLGLLVPLIILPDGTIIAGQRRYRAIEWLVKWFGGPITDGATWDTIARDLSVDEVEELRARARVYTTDGVPVRECGGDCDAIAIGDNLHEPLSSYELAVFLNEMHEADVRGREIARMIGKSTTWVSRKLAAFRGAGAALRAAWRNGEIADERVQQLAELSHGEQVARLAMSGAPPRGPANRPKIDLVKDVLGELERRARTADRATPTTPRERQVFEDAVKETLRWVAGQPTSETFVKLVQPDGGG